MKAALSAAGYAKAVNVIRLEGCCARSGVVRVRMIRDPENYMVTMSGASPRPHAPWGWRLKGHQLSLDFTLAPGRPVAVTQAFFGANPALRSGPGPRRRGCAP